MFQVHKIAAAISDQLTVYKRQRNIRPCDWTHCNLACNPDISPEILEYITSRQTAPQCLSPGEKWTCPCISETLLILQGIKRLCQKTSESCTQCTSAKVSRRQVTGAAKYSAYVNKTHAYFGCKSSISVYTRDKAKTVTESFYAYCAWKSACLNFCTLSARAQPSCVIHKHRLRVFG